MDHALADINHYMRCLTCMTCSSVKPGQVPADLLRCTKSTAVPLCFCARMAGFFPDCKCIPCGLPVRRTWEMLEVQEGGGRDSWLVSTAESPFRKKCNQARKLHAAAPDETLRGSCLE